MEEEIFGPILPIISYKDISEAIEIVNGKPKALALYLFTKDSKVQEKILSETSAGGVCVNDCGIHFFHHNLPFGGVNNSGIGKSHGHYGFLAFSNEKPILKQRGGLTYHQTFFSAVYELLTEVHELVSEAVLGRNFPFVIEVWLKSFNGHRPG